MTPPSGIAQSLRLGTLNENLAHSNVRLLG